MTIYSGFSHWKLWFSIAMLVYQRVHKTSSNGDLQIVFPSCFFSYATYDFMMISVWDLGQKDQLVRTPPQKMCVSVASRGGKGTQAGYLAERYGVSVLW